MAGRSDKHTVPETTNIWNRFTVALKDGVRRLSLPERSRRIYDRVTGWLKGQQSGSTIGFKIRRLWSKTVAGLKRVFSAGEEFALGLKIRWKLILIVGISVVVVTFVITTVAVNRQEQELRAMTIVLGTNLVDGLSNVAKDNLLLESYPPIQDYISNLSYGAFPGLEYFFVMNRNGRAVAHSIADSINSLVPPEDFDRITSADSTVVLETEDQLLFVQSVSIYKQGVKYVLGGTSATFTKEVMFARIAEMKERILTTGVVVSLLAIAVVYLFSTKIVGVIVILSEAARRVGEGDLKVAVVTRVKDELGLLAKEFNMMVVQIREKTEMQKFVSRAAVQMISEKKEATLGGTRRVITAMFTDIRNFTSVAESQWPEEVVVVLNYYLNVQTKIIHNHGGVVDKFIGDGIMSFFT
jgi:HAMP domain-containing protein